jgi:hypothetical protein
MVSPSYGATDTMNKDDWKAFMVWLETASEEDLETKRLRIEAISAGFREEGPKADARKTIGAIRLELDARRATR